MLNDTIYPFINKLIDEKINATESDFVLLDAPTLLKQVRISFAVLS